MGESMRRGRLRRFFGARRERELERLVEERTRALAEEKAYAERARREAEEASRAKSEFLANVSHELSSSLGHEDTAEIRTGLTGSLRILLAEDNSVNQKVALLLLERLGYRADVAANGLAALAALRRQSYDVVLMDVQMPEMDGLEAARRIRAEWPPQDRPRIIAMTANALRGDREVCLEAGMDDYLSKPILMDELRQALLRASLVSREGRRPGPSMPSGDVAVEPPILEMAALDSLFRLEQVAGREIVRGIVDNFLTEVPARLARMRQAIVDGDVEGLNFIAHDLKGSAAQLGALRLAEACRELEGRSGDGHLEGAGELLRLLEGEASRASAALLTRLRGSIPSPLPPAVP
jgi:CheY-like chemotaxis protein/HPt (histidine-containing phosphotransfer) domain-containing protein